MARLSIPLTEEQRNAIKGKAAREGLSMAEVARRLLFTWLADEIALPSEGRWAYDDPDFSLEHWNLPKEVFSGETSKGLIYGGVHWKWDEETGRWVEK